jgi:hypothetical protein
MLFPFSEQIRSWSSSSTPFRWTIGVVAATYAPSIAVPYLVFAVCGLVLLWRQPPSSYGRWAWRVPALFALVVGISNLVLALRTGVRPGEAAFLGLLLAGVAIPVGYAYALIVVLAARFVRHRMDQDRT